MLLYICLAFAAVVAVVLILAALRPAEFRVERRLAMSAPPARPFAETNDFHRWQAWSPYEKLDPAMERTFTGPATGVGAAYAWSGNAKAGAGRITIVESQPAGRIRLKLEMFKPFAVTNLVEFTYVPTGDQTMVTWSMTGRCNLMFKVFGLFVDTDKLCGRDFEAGLAALKTIVEAPGPTVSRPAHPA
jgi:polyketide cyclase/dehydrase/lipid transport protein